MHGAALGERRVEELLSSPKVASHSSPRPGKQGPLTHSRTGRACISVGDPGLLTPHIIRSAKPARNRNPLHEYGLILHHKHAGNRDVIDRFAHLPVKLIDIRTANIDKFVSELQSCNTVISQSLHGLIIADSLGIPNVWLELGPIHSGGSFKFLDYFSSVGRPPYRKLSTVPGSSGAIDSNTFEPDLDRIATLQKDILRAFESGIDAWRAANA